MNSSAITIETTPLLVSSQDIDSPNFDNERVTQAIETVINSKRANRTKALKSFWERYNPLLIGGDVFCTASLGLQGAIALAPSIALITGIALTNVACGIIGGVINIGVAGTCLKECIQAFKNGDNLLGVRLAVDTAGLFILGAIMILTSLSVIIGALGGVGAFLASNPWILPVIFFILTFPTMIEVSKRIISIWREKDLISQINSNEIGQLLENTDIDWNHQALSCTGQHPLNVAANSNSASLSTKMEAFQASMGVDAALAAFDLMKALHNKDKEKALEALAAFNKCKKSWYFAQHVRFIQQLFFSLSFSVSMVGASGSFNNRTVELLTAGQNFALSIANLIPFYMDTFWPFKRNIPIVVPKLELTKEAQEKTPLLVEARAS